MNKIIENLWAKKRSDENGQFWLPLLIHLKGKLQKLKNWSCVENGKM